MIRRALILGFFSIGGQVLLLRELVAVLNGDELFIATALFGWLLAVALGAFIGGRRTLNARSATLFLIGAVALPVVIVAIRLTPLIIIATPGQIIPFSLAAALSCVAMLPIGVISGWLFPSITRGGGEATDSIARVYLFEGIGAFIGGLAILIVVGQWLSALQAAIAIILIILLVGVMPSVGRLRPKLVLLVLTIAIGGVLLKGVRPLERWIDEKRYESYEVLASFDTHYGRQAILQREGELILLTDNTVEAVYPGLSAAENLLIPPLIYYPYAARILFVGRPEFGVGQLADQLSNVELTFIDPRGRLTEELDQLPALESSAEVSHYSLNWMYAPLQSDPKEYDIVIFNPGSPDTYRSSRYLTKHFLDVARLSTGGIVCVPTGYDTDSHISPEERQLLSIIYQTLAGSYAYNETWPGSSTLMFGSDSPLFRIPFDSIRARLSRLGYEPQFVSEDYLADRLSPFKKERLDEAVVAQKEIHTIDKPLLPHYQAMYRAKSDSFDRVIMKLVSSGRMWLIGVPIVLGLLFLFAIVGQSAQRRAGLFLYYVAGVVSLSLELIAFYTVQSYFGSLYSVMTLLIGAFMLGLSAGTYLGWRARNRYMGHLALTTLLLALLVFFRGYRVPDPLFSMLGHLAFLFIVAGATGMLFVAATKIYYASGRMLNQGMGYAVELVGSSAGALLATPILLPLIGLDWLLIGLMTLVGLAFVALLRTRP